MATIHVHNRCTRYEGQRCTNFLLPFASSLDSDDYGTGAICLKLIRWHCESTHASPLNMLTYDRQYFHKKKKRKEKRATASFSKFTCIEPMVVMITEITYTHLTSSTASIKLHLLSVSEITVIKVCKVDSLVPWYQ